MRIKLLTMLMVALVLSAFTLLAVPQESSFSVVQTATADALSDSVNGSMESYVPILLTLIFVVLVIQMILTLRKAK